MPHEGKGEGELAYTGALNVNGITDKDLVKILEVKIKHEKSLIFNPQQLQPAQVQGRAQNDPQTYNNANFNWQDEDGLEAVHKIISILLKKEERGEAAKAGA